MPVTNAANVMNMLERLPIAVVICDIATGEILWVNGPHARLSGAESPDRIIGRSLFDFLSPDQLTIAMRDVEAVGRGESPAPVTYHVRKLDGTAADVQIASTSMMYGRRPAMVSFVTDVTDSENAISDLARREARYRAMVDESPAGIFVSIREGLAYANAAFARMLGAETPDRLLGTRTPSFFAPESRDTLREARNRLLVHGSDRSVEMAATMLRLDGTPADVRVVLSTLLWDGDPAFRFSVRPAATSWS